MNRHLALFTLMLSCQASAAELTVGKPFPEITLPSIHDSSEKLSTSAFAGKKWMVHVFASW